MRNSIRFFNYIMQNGCKPFNLIRPSTSTQTGLATGIRLQCDIFIPNSSEEIIFYEDKLVGGSVVFRHELFSNGVRFGACPIQEFNFAVYNDNDEFTNYDYSDAYINVYCNAYDNRYPSFTSINPLGTFKITKIEVANISDYKILKFQSQDIMSLLDTALLTINSNNSGGYISTILTLINNKLSSISSTNKSISVGTSAYGYLPNGTRKTVYNNTTNNYRVASWTEAKTYTVRQWLMYVYELVGCIGIDASNIVYDSYHKRKLTGSIRMHPAFMMASDPSSSDISTQLTVTRDMVGSSTFDIYDVTITGVKIILESGEEYLFGTDTYAIVLDKNPLIDANNVNNIGTNLYNTYNGYKFRTGSISLKNTPQYELNDCLKYTDPSLANPLNFLVTRKVYKPYTVFSTVESDFKTSFNNLDLRGSVSGKGSGSSNAVQTNSNASLRSLSVSDDLQVAGTKSRIVHTEDYGDHLLYAYETASPLFGDLGEGTIGNDGLCYVDLDPVLEEVIANNYQVFLTPYGEGTLYIKERNSSYFIVKGTEGLQFSWEVKAKQVDYDQLRLENKEE